MSSINYSDTMLQSHDYFKLIRALYLFFVRLKLVDDVGSWSGGYRRRFGSEG